MDVSRALLRRTFLAIILAFAGTPCVVSQTGVSYADQRGAAIALQQRGQLAEAGAAWESILKAHPEDAEACANLGVIESQQQHYAEAVRYYRRAAAIRPSMPGLRMNLGLALFKAGDMKEAASVFERLYPQAAPDSPYAQRLPLLIGL